MALSFPIFYGSFWEKLRIRSLRFQLGEAMTTAETGAGEVLTSNRGVRLWEGDAAITANTRHEQDQVIALMDVMRRPGASFIVYDPARRWSQHDPDGTIQGVETCAVSSVNANGRKVVLKGLSAGYVLTVGDHVSIAYGSSPTRYYLGRVVVGDTFIAGTPTTAEVELVPNIPPGVTADDPVTLRRAYCKAVYVPGSFTGPERGPVTDGGWQFSWRQTLR